jgi:ribosome assembly protein YihI (activator of Der GTPase)
MMDAQKLAQAAVFPIGSISPTQAAESANKADRTRNNVKNASNKKKKGKQEGSSSGSGSSNSGSGSGEKSSRTKMPKTDF